MTGDHHFYPYVPYCNDKWTLSGLAQPAKQPRQMSREESGSRNKVLVS
jgi:hypothetical protein